MTLIRLLARAVLAALVIGPGMLAATSPGQAAFACRTENGKRKCGLVQTVPAPSAVPNPGVSPSVVPDARTPPPVGKPARKCTQTSSGKRLCR